MCYTLGLENNKFLRYPVAKFFEGLSAGNISHSMYYTKNAKKVIIKLFISDDKIEYVSDLVADFIIENYSEKRALKMIDTNYHYFNEEEKIDILNRIFQKAERKKVSELIQNYLEKSDHLFPEGFSVFRMGEYYECLENSIEMIVDDMLLNREYNEFVNMLRQFVVLQESEYRLINIYKPRQGRYIILDDKNAKLTSADLGEYMYEIAEEELTVYDMLLSDLVSIAPKNIVIHNKENFESAEVLRTIEMVFDGKVSYCKGCKHCEKYRQK